MRHYFNGWAVLGTLPVVVMVIHQYHLIKHKERLSCFGAFRQNAWVGRYVLALIVGCAFLKFL